MQPFWRHQTRGIAMWKTSVRIALKYQRRRTHHFAGNRRRVPSGRLLLRPQRSAAPYLFALRRGEIVGLLGPNGAGKSTTIKLITGILVPTAGAITVASLPLPEKAIQVKQIIGYVPQTAVLFDSLTAQQFLALSGLLH